MRRHNVVLAAFAGFAVAATAVLGFGVVVSSRGANPGSAAIGGPFALVDDNGTSVTEAALASKPSVIYFGYTFCPEVCPTTLLDLSNWIKKLGPDADRINYVFITVDPERDTPKLMRSYLSSFDRRIRGFTGTPEQIAEVAREYRVYYKKVPTDDGGYVMDHSAIIYLMGSDGKFVSVIAYQEPDESALAKLRSLVTLAPSS